MVTKSSGAESDVERWKARILGLFGCRPFLPVPSGPMLDALIELADREDGDRPQAGQRLDYSGDAGWFRPQVVAVGPHPSSTDLWVCHVSPYNEKGKEAEFESLKLVDLAPEGWAELSKRPPRKEGA